MAGVIDGSIKKEYVLHGCLHHGLDHIEMAWHEVLLSMYNSGRESSVAAINLYIVRGAMGTWNMDAGVVELPSGCRIRGRSWNEPVSEMADVSVILTTATPSEFAERHAQGIAHDAVYISWPDGRIPRRPRQAIEQLKVILDRAEHERVEITSGTGVGRTGTALAVLAIFEGMEPDQAVSFIQSSYHSDAVMGHAQSGFLAAMEPGAAL